MYLHSQESRENTFRGHDFPGQQSSIFFARQITQIVDPNRVSTTYKVQYSFSDECILST